MGVFSYYDAETDGVVYHVIPSPESEHPPSIFGPESDSTGSRMTIQSDDLPDYFILHHGRQQPASPGVARWFPTDSIRRYAVRYMMIKSLFGDLPSPLMAMLAPKDGGQRQVLELGTRTGVWIQAIARQFPHVHFRTLDVVPLVPHVQRPNIRFDVYDYTGGLLLDDESQDVVCLNFILETARNYRFLLHEAYRVLRPGGFIYILDFNPRPWDPEDAEIPTEHTNLRAPRARSIGDHILRHLANIGIDPDTCDKLPEWLAPGSNLWDKGQGGFKDLQSIVRTYPVYPHEGFSCMEKIDATVAPYLQHLAAKSIRDMLGVLKDAGVGDEEAEKLIEDTLEEQSQHENCVLLKIYSIHAIKV